MHVQLLIRYLTIRKYIRDNILFLALLLNYDKVVKLSTDYHEVAVYNRRHNPFTLTEMPRGTYKTTLFTIVESIQDILINRNITILICHFAGANARDFLTEIKTHFEINEELRFSFPEIVPQNLSRPESENWTNVSITVNRSKEALHIKEGSIEAMGSEQALASKHFDKIKFDDITVEASSTTVDQIKKANNFLIRAYSLLKNDELEARSLSITGTEWVPDDTMVKVKKGEILAPDGKAFKLFRIPAERTDDTNTRVPLFPEILSLETLDGLRASQRTTYHAFYLLDAEEFEDQVWSKNKIKWYDELPGDRTFKIYGAIDPALTTSDVKNGCDTACAIIAKDELNELWVLEYKLGKGVDVIYNWLFELHDKWKKLTSISKKEDGTTVLKENGTFRFFSIEATLFQQLIAKELRKQMSEKNKWIPLRESYPIKEKTKRIYGAIDPLISNGVLHAKNGMSELETQIIRFGRPGQKVDLLDAIAQAELESNTVWKKEKKKKTDEEYEAMYANAYIV